MTGLTFVGPELPDPPRIVRGIVPMAMFCKVPESVTVTATTNEPPCLGVPEMIPVFEMRSPSGNFDAFWNRNGVTPPAAETWAAYGTPTAPVGNVVVRRRNGNPTTVKTVTKFVVFGGTAESV